MDQERYQLVDVIGSGGMATVWRAHDTRLGRVVAIKRPHPAPADSTTLPRFAREARAAATVSHPNLVSVYDVGEDAAGPFIVMEFVDGPSLSTTAVPPEGVAAVGVQLASALAALHAAGIVHGDVKPANILVAGDRMKLTDFGIARTGTDTTALTREGIIFATPEYAAPETMTTGERSAAGDVYALGAVLHELLTGSRWNPTTTATATMPPAAWLPSLSAALDRDPRRRPSAAAFGAELARLQTGGSTLPTTVASAAATSPPTLVSPAPTGHRENRRTAMAIFSGSILALAVLAGVVASRSDGVATMISRTEQSLPDEASLVSTSIAAPETMPAQTTPPATDPPATEPPPSTAPATTISPAREQAQALADLTTEEMSIGLARNEAIAIVESLNEALEAADAGREDDTVRALRDVLRRIDRRFSDDTADDAIDRLLAVGAELGVDPDQITDDDRDRDDD